MARNRAHPTLPVDRHERCDSTTQQGNHCCRRPSWQVVRHDGRPVGRVCDQHRRMMADGRWIPWHGG